MTIQKYTKEEIDTLEDKTDYERLKKMTQEDIRKNADSDSDVPLQYAADLENFKPAKRDMKNIKKIARTNNAAVLQWRRSHNGKSALCLGLLCFIDFCF